MTDTALNTGGNTGDSIHWSRRAALITFCLALVVILAVVFTRVIAARVPEQRATLEKLITDRTGLAVRFENVHFAWDLDGTSAVFTRVELTDPAAGRVRVVAPELRVEFDAWDFLRHHQFSLGHVTLSSPDIEIIADAHSAPAPSGAARTPAGRAALPDDSPRDELALVRRYTAWAELMPNGRIQVEGARVHLMRRGDRAARRSFTLSQAVVSRSASTFHAYGTMLLAQDVGQSLFVSAKLEGLGAKDQVAGDLRVIARRVFLDKAGIAGVDGRGTIDAKLRLEAGRIHAGEWTASARELIMNGEAGARFNHLTMSGRLTRDAGDVLIDLDDLQLTRGARLERAPKIAARLAFEPGTLRIARTTMRAERIPFMASELLAGLLAPRLEGGFPALADGWTPTAGELRDLRFDSGPRRRAPDSWTFSAQLSRAELTRAADRARLGDLAAHVRLDAQGLELTFDPANAVMLRMDPQTDARSLELGGKLAFAADSRLHFDEFVVASGDTALVASGEWSEPGARTAPLELRITNLDRAVAAEAWSLLSADMPPPALLAEVQAGSIIDGSLTLSPMRDAAGRRAIDWGRTRGKLELADLATAGKDLPALHAGRGALTFARSGATLRLDAGQFDDLAVTSARFDWPRGGTPRLTATLAGGLDSPLIKPTLAAHGLERLTGEVAIDVDARGAEQIADSARWRVTARLSGATVPLAGGLPPVESLTGTLRYANGQWRGLALAGRWLGGPVEIASRRASDSAGLHLALNGIADAAALLRAGGGRDAANQVTGALAWSGSAQRAGDDAWELSFASNLAGVESRLPKPFDKTRARAAPVTAGLRVDARGIRSFSIDGRDLAIAGDVRDGVTSARFDIQDIAGQLRRGASPGANLEVEIATLELKRAPVVLAAAAALLPPDADLALTVGELAHSRRSLGALHASLSRAGADLSFEVESPEASQHQLAAQGRCAAGRCTAEFSADTAQLALLLADTRLPDEWPKQSLHAAGELSWPQDDAANITRILAGTFDIEVQGSDPNHQMLANATLAGGEIQLANVQGSGPDPTLAFRGSGRMGLIAGDYDLTVDYEPVALAAVAVPTPARARLSRAWNTLRGSAAKHGWAEAPETRRVQWHGYWTSRVSESSGGP